jgi:hypothetical protein
VDLSFVLMLVVVIGVVALLYGLTRPTKAKTSGVASSEQVGQQFAHLKGDGKFAVDVVGESHYRENLVRLTQAHWRDTRGDDLDCIATLHLEDTNQHDPQAVQVRINGMQVGYLSREMARDIRQAIARDGPAPRREFAVTAKVWIPDRPQEDHFSVSLDLPTSA